MPNIIINLKIFPVFCHYPDYEAGTNLIYFSLKFSPCFCCNNLSHILLCDWHDYDCHYYNSHYHTRKPDFHLRWLP